MRHLLYLHCYSLRATIQIEYLMDYIYGSQFIPKVYYIYNRKDENGFPMYNPGGKYAIKVFLFGHFRKIIIDDYIPLDYEVTPLLARSSYIKEIWPMLIHKAILKIKSYFPPSPTLYDPNIFYYLYGWIPKYISQGSSFWDYLQQSTPIVTESIPILEEEKIEEVKKSKGFLIYSDC